MNMKGITYITLAAVCMTALVSCGGRKAADAGLEENGRWTVEKASEWFEKTGWRSGCDFIPSTAINQIEMWQSSTFDRETIDRELGWAEELGFTTVRTYLSSVVYANEPEVFKKTMDTYLGICDSHGIKPVLVFFDDCWNPESGFGPQPEPRTGVHNSGWVRDPSHSLRADTTALFPVLEKYVKDVLTTFKDDERVLWWDLYNEPGGNNYCTESLPLVKKTFQWAREVRPSQPVSVGIWTEGPAIQALNDFQLENSDIISYHNYSPLENHIHTIDTLRNRAPGRPLVCTEYMARKSGSTFQAILPMMKEQGVSAINWGFVSGKTNTIFAWGDPHPEGGEPELWFHDIYRTDKTPFSEDEIDVIKSVNGVQ